MKPHVTTEPEKRPRRKLLVLSHVLPFPRTGGQQQRVFYTLKAARERFDVTFATTATTANERAVRSELSSLCDHVLLMSDRRTASPAAKLWHRAAGAVYAAGTGLKRSNYDIGHVQFAPDRVAELVGTRHFDCVLFEYWHAAANIPVFRRNNVPCVLDMHDILWQAYSRQLAARTNLPQAWKRWALDRYKAWEERTWGEFDALVAINREEEKYVKGVFDNRKRVFHAAMGTDLNLWPYSWEPARPRRVAYYGSLASPHNQEGALMCAQQIMPELWRCHPDAELWLVGSHPPPALRRLPEEDPRIHVTGYVEEVQDLLRTMTAVICPWSGTYGFRSRLVEVMALGTPVVASPDAISGMELEDGQGVLLGDNAAALAHHADALLTNDAFAAEQSRLARDQVESLFSLERTYMRFVRDLEEWVCGL